MPKILINECEQEVSSFNPAMGFYGDFTVCRGADMVARHRNAADVTFRPKAKTFRRHG